VCGANPDQAQKGRVGEQEPREPSEEAAGRDGRAGRDDRPPHQGQEALRGAECPER